MYFLLMLTLLRLLKELRCCLPEMAILSKNLNTWQLGYIQILSFFTPIKNLLKPTKTDSRQFWLCYAKNDNRLAKLSLLN